jgi:predicted O-methyltransferase YrrM
MSSKATHFSGDLARFILENAIVETDILRRLREETALHPMSIMQISPTQGAFMGVLAKSIGATRMLEIGTFTGYSSLVVLEAMGPAGSVVTCDVSEEYTAIARTYWREAEVDSRVDLRLGDAVDTLKAMIEQGRGGTFDIAFIDANKEQYPSYYDLSLELVRPGGMILLDNMFMDGGVADPRNDEEGVVAIRGLYATLRKDPRVAFSVVPIADGLGIALKL